MFSLNKLFTSNIVRIVTAVILVLWGICELYNTQESAEATNQESYTPPPSYRVWGRGLVYDCAKKEWACVGRYAYLQCRANMKWNVGHDRPYECYVVHVYGTDIDCILVQLHHLTIPVETNFCHKP